MTDEEAVEVALAKYQPIQERVELVGAAKMVRELAPLRIAEVGTYRGGSLFVWHNASAHGCRFVGVDTPGTPDTVLEDMRSWLRPGEACELYLADSKSPETAKRAADFLGGPIDFLFIDADHDYASVSADFAAWAPHVRRGGLIGFHDILRSPDRQDIEVWKMWAEFKALGWEAHEFVGPPEHQYGIGVCRKP